MHNVFPSSEPPYCNFYSIVLWYCEHTKFAYWVLTYVKEGKIMLFPSASEIYVAEGEGVVRTVLLS
jgi:hypothetical protein